MRGLLMFLAPVALVSAAALTQGRQVRHAPPIPHALRTAASQGLNFQIVRVEYAVRIRPRGQIDTDLILQNTSATETLKLGDLVLLGRGGLQTVLRVHQGLKGQRIPPLAQVTVPVDAKIGATPRGNAARHLFDLASIVVSWEGSSESLELRAAIYEREPSSSNTGYGAGVETEGFPLRF